MDFTLEKYKQLLLSLRNCGYDFQTLEDYLQCPKEKTVVLRHDVDLKAENSLAVAKIEHKLGIKASYYFRIIPQSNNSEIIKQIVALGHEIGYHYEDFSLLNGDFEKAITHFEDKLNYFRQYYPVKTICMHGSPTSKIDNRVIWEKYDYRNFGIIGEPYLDIDFNQMLYLTDTGRCWDGEKYSVRDKVKSSFEQSYHTTNQLIEAVKSNELPNRLMITTHPQRWTDNKIEWAGEWLSQHLKNAVKRIFINAKRLS